MKKGNIIKYTTVKSCNKMNNIIIQTNTNQQFISIRKYPNTYKKQNVKYYLLFFPLQVQSCKSLDKDTSK